MRRLAVPIVLVLAAAGLSGQSNASQTKGGQSPEEIVLQMERDWTRADLTKDASTLDRILADEWTEIDYDGRTVTKSMVLADMKNGSAQITAIETGERKIRVYGNVAIVTGSDTEQSNDHGKDTSGKYVWTDVFLNRNGKWQAIASQATKVG